MVYSIDIKKRNEKEKENLTSFLRERRRWTNMAAAAMISEEVNSEHFNQNGYQY